MRRMGVDDTKLGQRRDNTFATSDAVEVLDVHDTGCCIVGSGPGGMMLALLLARRGVPVTLLEAHPTFERDFRGDTLHPAILEILDEIGVADRLHELPHVKALRPDHPDAYRALQADRSSLPEDALPVHPGHAAGALPGIPGRGGREIPQLSAGDGSQRAAAGRGGRCDPRRSLPRGRRLARSPRPAHRWRGRPILPFAAPGRVQAGHHLAAAGAAVVSPAPPGDRPAGNRTGLAAHRSGPAADRHRPGRPLAGRLFHPPGTLPANPGSRRGSAAPSSTSSLGLPSTSVS